MLRTLISLCFVGVALAGAICPTVSSCQPNLEAKALPPAQQPNTDNGSCAEMVRQCQIWIINGLFQNKYCVLASFCYAWSNTDDLLQNAYPASSDSIPNTSQEARLSEDVFYNMTGGADTMSQQNAIDGYYGALTGTWGISGGEVAGAMLPVHTDINGPYPTSPGYVIAFWEIISAWTGFCDTREIPYSNLADYLSYAAGSNYHPTC